MLFILVCTSSLHITVKAADVQPSNLNEYYIQAAETLDRPISPFEYGTFTTGWVDAIDAIGASLYQKDPSRGTLENDFIPELADGFPDISDDGKTFTIHLQENLKFSNGEPLDAGDVGFTYSLFLTPNLFGTDYSARYTSLSSILSSNSSIAVIDDLTLEFHFDSISINNYEALVNVPIIEMTDSHLSKYNGCVGGVSADCEWKFADSDVFISAGPLKLESYTLENSTFVLTKNDNYPYPVWIDKLTLEGNLADKSVPELIESQKADQLEFSFSYDELENLTQPNSYVITNWPHREDNYLLLNFLNPYYGTGDDIPHGPQAVSNNNLIQAKMVRFALSYIMDRDYYSRIWGHSGIPTINPLPQTTKGYNTSIPVHEFSIETAKSYMEMAGFDYNNITDYNNDGDYGDVNDTTFFNVTITNLGNADDRQQYIDHILPNFAKIGIGVKPAVNSGCEIVCGAYLNQTLVPQYDDGGFDMLIATYVWSIPTVTDHQFSEDGLCTSNDPYLQCSNIINYVNPVLENIINEFENAADFDDRYTYVNELQQMLVEELPVITLIDGHSPSPIKNDVVQASTFYLDQGIYSWRDVHKQDWEIRSSNGNSPKVDTTLVIEIAGGVVIIVIAAVFLIRRKAFL